MDFILEDIDWRKILIRRYKSYHLNENDLAVILLINELNRGVPHFVSPEEIEPYTTLASEKIEEIMSKLIKAGYASIDGVSFSVNCLKKRIFNDTIKEVALATDKKIDCDKDTSPYYELLQKVIKRQLTSLEYDIVSSWIGQNLTIEKLNDIISFVSKKKKNISIAVLDKEYQTRRRNETKIAEDAEAEQILKAKLYNLSKNED